jgi:LacI family transcriptional regulator
LKRFRKTFIVDAMARKQTSVAHHGKEMRPTLKSLAAITGLGISTISQALRDSPDIAIETRNRVKLAAQQVGYRPNRAGVRLRTGKSNVLALVLNAQDGGSGFISNLVFGISEALGGTPYHLVVTPYSLSDPMAPIRYIVETSSADGVIISRIQADDPRVRYLDENKMPFVTHGRTDMGIDHCYVDYDNQAYAFKALELLAQRGRKRVCLVSPPPTLNYYTHTQRGFGDGVRAFKMIHLPLSSISLDSSDADIKAAVCGLIDQSGPPDGIVASSISAVPAIAAGMLEAGLVCGKHYDLVAKPFSETLSMMLPQVIFLNEDFRLAGQELARMLVKHINGGEKTALQFLDGPQ